MKKEDVIRALKDEDYFLGLSDSERAQLPSHPAGVIDLDEDALRDVTGALKPCLSCLSVFGDPIECCDNNP